MNYRKIDLPNFVTLREINGQLRLEQFDGTNIQLLGRYRAGRICSLERFSMFFNLNPNCTIEEIKDYLSNREYEDAAFSGPLF